MPKGRPIRIAGKRKRIPMSQDQIEVLKKYSFLLGLSEDQACEALFSFGMHFVMELGDNQIALLSKAGLSEKEKQRDDYLIFLNERIERAPGKTGMALSQMSLNLALTQFPAAKDPIKVTLSAVANHFWLEKEEFLKKLYILFLDANDLLEGDRLVAPYISIILAIKKIDPYGWASNPWNNYDDLKIGKLKYSFLSSGKHGHKNRVTIRRKQNQDDLIFQTLHLFCKSMYRDKSSFFQMLYMYFLKEIRLLDKNFELVKNWEFRLQKMDRSLRLKR